jgi:hypothetical protein
MEEVEKWMREGETLYLTRFGPNGYLKHLADSRARGLIDK